MNNIEEFQIKPISYKDLNTILKWRNSKNIKSTMYTEHQITWEEHTKWYQKITSDPKEMVFVFYHKDRPLGVVNFSDINKLHSRCYWGFYIGEESAPQGSGTIMGVLALNKIFKEIGLHKVCAEVIASNNRSYRYHQKLGFEPEGRLVDHVCKNDQYEEVIPMGLFSNRWEIKKHEILKQLKGG